MTIESDRQDQLETHIPDIWSYRSYLYVGANDIRFHFKDALAKCVANGAILDLVEVDRQRYIWLRKQPFVRRAYWADVGAWAFDNSQKYDAILWSHGPTCIGDEHILKRTIMDLMRVAGLLVMMCPYGIYKKHKNVALSKSKNPKDNNNVTLYPGFFTQLNCLVHTLGAIDVAGSNLLAWHRNPKSLYSNIPNGRD